MSTYENKQLYSYCDTSITNPEGLESYVVKQIIGRGSCSIVHLATCTRGRLRGRDVALKFVPFPPPTPSLESMRIATTALHKSLHHPAIVALHSEFSTAGHHCLVLELCEGGSLWDFLYSRKVSSVPGSGLLNEICLRPILRSMVEALFHIHSRGIVHQALNAHNVFLTADGRAKLGGFGHSSVLLEDNKYLSKEPEGRRQHTRTATDGKYGTQADLRCLGHLSITLLTGTPPEAKNGTMHDINASDGPSILLPTIKCSKEAEALITTLLKHNSDESVLENLLSLPFFHHTQRTEFLNPGRAVEVTQEVTKAKREGNVPPTPRGIQVYVDAQAIQQEPPHLREVRGLDTIRDTGHHIRNTKTKLHLPYRMPSTWAASKSVSNSKFPVEPCTNESRPPSGSSTAAASGIRDAWTKLTTRQRLIDHNTLGETSEPLPTNNERVQASPHPGQGKRKAFADVGNWRIPSTPGVGVGIKENHIVTSGLLSPPDTHHSHSEAGPSPAPQSSKRVSGREKPIPRTNLPTAFKVSPLFPQTHKLGHGQMVVQPSRSVLVDLREGERRAGSQGDCVLCISANGQEIRVYDAPHLSTPCILSEPVAKWTLSTLPTQYWESYAFAGKFIESLKKRTPLMVWYTEQAKITLMSNGPQGDVHAVFPCPSPGAQNLKRGRTDRVSKASISLRIVLSRVYETVEVERFAGGVWVTKKGPYPAKAGELGLDLDEKTGLECVVAALHVCDAAEAHCVPSNSMDSREPEEDQPVPEITDDQPFLGGRGSRIGSNKGVSLASRLPLTLAPRPQRIVSAATQGRRGDSRVMFGEG